MIVFRVDGNKHIGSGHIMRCLSLADALLDKGLKSVFIVAEKQFQTLIQERGFECMVLNSKYDQLDEELSNVLPLLEKLCPQLIILDSYFVTPEYMSTLRETTPLVYIDDLNMFDYPTDAVVNYNIYAHKMQYPQNKRYFLGPQYAPLRKEFSGLKREIEPKVINVLFSTGGTDLEHVALRCISYLKEHPELQELTYHFVIGGLNQDVAEIEKKARGASYIKLHKQVKDMKSLMMQCDIAVSAGGTTLYELCACGLPTITYIFADNQIMVAEGFEENGIMLCAGDVREKSTFEDTLYAKLSELVINWERREKLSGKMCELIDGSGAKRLAKAIINEILGRTKEKK